MSIDYSNGRYLVFASKGAPLGIIDGDEYVRNGLNLLYRIDGNEVYSLEGKHLGFIDDGLAKALDGSVIFSIRPE